MMGNTRRSLGALALVASLCGTSLAAPVALPARPASPPGGAASARAAYARLPLRFEVNRGQAGSRVRFMARGSGYTFALSDGGVVLALRHAATGASTTISLRPAGANAHPRIVGLDRLPGASNYLLGNDPRAWHTGVPSYARVVYHDVYRGVDLVYHGNAGHLEYDVVLAPGADLGAVGFDVRGAAGLWLDRQGNLVLHSAAGDLVQQRPVVYQQVAGRKQPVAGRYVLDGHGRVGFAVGRYDPRRPLVVDPVFSYSTYLGGTGGDVGTSIAVDGAGNAYVTGTTTSNNIPLANWYQLRNRGGAGNPEVFVLKLNPAGTALVYSTYLGGTGGDQANAIAVDGAGNAYVAGMTTSGNFPTLNAVQARNRGGQDAFVAKLSAAGNALLYSTYLGGHEDDAANGIAVDTAGNAYIAGSTWSKNFPTRNAFQPHYNGGQDAFVARLDAAGSVLTFSTYLGGNGKDTADAIAIDDARNIYVSGATGSTDFPNARALSKTVGGDTDAFVVRVNAAGSALLYSDLFGGNDIDEALAIAVDAAHNVYVTGYTASPNYASSTTAGAAQRAYGGGPRDAFVAELDPSGSRFIYNTLLGGNGDDIGRAIAVGRSGNAYVSGQTSDGSFPTTRDTVQRQYGGGSTDAFVAELDAAGHRLTYGSLLGGGDADVANGVAVDRLGNIYLAGATVSSDFPVKLGALQGGNRGGDSDLFVTKIDAAPVPLVDGYLPNLAPPIQSPGAYYVSDTDHSVAPPFVASFKGTSTYLLGNPVDEAYLQGGVLTQDFDHRTLQFRGGVIVVANLGGEVAGYQRRYDGNLAAALPGVRAVRSTAAVLYFAQTRHTLRGDLLRYWRANGGMAAFGAPISEVFRDTNGDGSGRTYLMQYFQKARIERHPENSNPRYAVLLGLLGLQALRERGWAR